MFLGSSFISWKCKKQERISKSSTEAEYHSMSSASSEIVWLRGLLADLGVNLQSPTPLHADNTSAIQIASNPVFHERTKHIEVDCHYIRKLLVNGTFPLTHVLSHAPRAFVSSAIFSGLLVRVVARCMVRVYMSWPICLLLSFLSYVYLSILTLNCNLTTMSSRLPTLSYVAFLYQYQSTGKRCPSITSRP